MTEKYLEDVLNAVPVNYTSTFKNSLTRKLIMKVRQAILRLISVISKTSF